MLLCEVKKGSKRAQLIELSKDSLAIDKSPWRWAKEVTEVPPSLSFVSTWIVRKTSEIRHVIIIYAFRDMDVRLFQDTIFRPFTFTIYFLISTKMIKSDKKQTIIVFFAVLNELTNTKTMANG